jgi:hypothetical protein
MQRIALGVCLCFAVLSGCTKPGRVAARPLPDPLLRTLHPTRWQIPPAPPPREVRPQVPKGGPGIALNERELIPRGGIKRGRWNVIVVHHSANNNDTPRSMDEYHTKVRKWANGLGYHFVIGNGVNTEDGRVYVGSRWKRQITGAHCKSSSGRYFGAWRKNNYFNEHGIGVCLIGNFEQRRPTRKQLAALEQLTQFLCSRTGINPAHVYGHGDVTHKTLCPGRYLSGKLPQVRRAVAQALAVKLDTGPPPGWPSGTDDRIAAGSNADLHRSVPAPHLLLKACGIAYAAFGDPIDYVADLYRRPFRGTGVQHIDHDDADGSRLDTHPIADLGREVGQPHAAPENRAAAHPAHAADLASAHSDLDTHLLVAAP